MNSPIYDEMRGLDSSGGDVLPHYRSYCDWLNAMPPDRLAQKRTEA